MHSLQEVYDVIAGTFKTTTFTGTGLDDMSKSGTFTGAAALDYRVQIDSVGISPAPDTFSWSDDGGVSWDGTLLPITGSAQAIGSEGVIVSFGNTNNHTLGDRWDFSTNSLANIDGNVMQQLKYISENLSGTSTTLQLAYDNSVSPEISGNKATTLLTLNQTGTGDIFELQKSSAPVFTVDNAGNVTISGTMFSFAGAGEISSGGTSDLNLNAGSGRIMPAAGDAFYTSDGTPIRASGEEIYRTSMPILGYDYPAQTSLASYVKISRAIILEEGSTDSFPAAMAGTTRIYKIGIRYATDNVLAVSTWQVWDTSGSGSETSFFTVPAATSLSLDEGTIYITPAEVAVPASGSKWYLNVSVAAGKIRIYQVNLMAYDVVD